MEIRYKAGKDNVVADALSRAPVNNINTTKFIVEDWIKEQKEDEFCKTILQQLSQSPRVEDGSQPEERDQENFHILENGLLAHPSGRIVVPKTLQKDLLFRYHDHKLGGHLGMMKTHASLRSKYYFPKMRAIINTYIGNCVTCAKRKTHRLNKAPLQPIPVTGYTWQRLALDYIGPLPVSFRGNRHILVIVESLTKYGIAIATRDTTAKTTARKFIKHVVLQEGLPEEIITDRAAYFQSDLMAQLCKQLGVKHLRGTSFHPMNQGQVENLNKLIANGVAAFAKRNPATWDEFLAYVLSRYNRTPHASTGETPSYLLKRRDPLEPTDLRPPMRYQVLEDENDIFAQYYHEALELARNQQVLAKAKQKEYYDKTARMSSYKVDDKVLLHIRKTQVGKWYDRWEGPYVIVRKISDVNYLVRAEEKEHTFVVHVNRMKKSFGENDELGLEGQVQKEKSRDQSKTSLTESDSRNETATPPLDIAPPSGENEAASLEPPTTSQTVRRNTASPSSGAEKLDPPNTDKPASASTSTSEAARADIPTPKDKIPSSAGGEKSDTRGIEGRRPGRPKGTTKKNMETRKRVTFDDSGPPRVETRTQGHKYGLREKPKRTDRL